MSAATKTPIRPVERLTAALADAKRQRDDLETQIAEAVAGRRAAIAAGDPDTALRFARFIDEAPIRRECADAVVYRAELALAQAQIAEIDVELQALEAPFANAHDAWEAAANDPHSSRSTEDAARAALAEQEAAGRSLSTRRTVLQGEVRRLERLIAELGVRSPLDSAPIVRSIPHGSFSPSQPAWG